jgi:hypothetical protein
VTAMQFLLPLLTFLAPVALALLPPSCFEIARLIEQLGSPCFQEREQASKRL